MAQKVIARVSGLATDASPLISAEAGGMRIAANAVIDSPGVARQRPTWDAGTSVSTSNRPRRMYAWGSSVVVSEWDGASAWGTRYLSGGTAITYPSGLSDGAQPLDVASGFPQFVEARRSLYWTSINGMMKVASSADTTAERAGLGELGTGTLASTGTVAGLPANSARAYRWCTVKTDANGLVVRSAPSQWQKHVNSTGAAVSVACTIPLTSVGGNYGVTAGDIIELYASVSVPSTDVPADMLYLVKTYVVTSADVTLGYALITDDVPDTQLGRELYTNPTREGILKANGRPLPARAAARWSSCVWLGGTSSAWTSIMQLRQVAGYLVAVTNRGLAVFSDNGSVTNGSNQLTGLSAPVAAALRPGMLITGNSNPIAPSRVPADTRVVSVAGTTVTMSRNATATSGPAVFYFHDGIEVTGLPSPSPALTLWANNGTTSGGGVSTFNVSSASALTTAREIAYEISRVNSHLVASVVEDPYALNGEATIILRAKNFNIAQWSVTSSNLSAFDYERNASNGVLVSRDDKPNRLIYSKPDEPEHFPELNFIDIGNEADPIMALSPLRGALLVFKRDGIFRVTGSAPDNWRVDVLDTVLRPLRGESVATLGETAAVYTQRGVFLVDEGGSQDISDGLVAETLITAARTAILTPTTYGVFVTALNESGLLLVGQPDSAGSAVTRTIYCWSQTTRAWTTWQARASAVTEARELGAFFLARSGEWRVSQSRSAFTGYDGSYSLTGWSYFGASFTVTPAQRGLWVPFTGDWVSATTTSGTEYRRITDVTLAGADYVCTLSSPFTGTPTANRTAYEGVLTRLQWQGLTPGSPATDALWREVQVQYDWSRWPDTIPFTARMLIGASTNRVTAITTQEWTQTVAPYASDTARIAAPRELARSAHLYPYVETGDILIDWRILGCALEYEPTSERTRR